MAPPLAPDTLLAKLKAEGVRVAEHPGWRVHNRNRMGPWGGVNGIVIHHTAGTNSLRICVDGVAGLPGPLCHTHLSKAGLATMVGYGRVNHAGTFAANAHRAVVNEEPQHPAPDAAELIDGNQHYYGIEIENLGTGRDPYPAVQYDAAVRWAAAICRAHGWTANSVIGHKEGTRRKIDPSFDMNAFRADVAERLTHSAGWSPGSEPPEDDMPLTAAEIDKVATAVLRKDGVISIPGAPADNPTWTLASAMTEVLKRLDKSNAQVAALTTVNAELVKTVATLVANVGDLDPAAIVSELKAAIESIDVRLEVDGA